MGGREGANENLGSVGNAAIEAGIFPTRQVQFFGVALRAPQSTKAALWP
jgi:hypothetical protein